MHHLNFCSAKLLLSLFCMTFCFEMRPSSALPSRKHVVEMYPEVKKETLKEIARRLDEIDAKEVALKAERDSHEGMSADEFSCCKSCCMTITYYNVFVCAGGCDCLYPVMPAVVVCSWAHMMYRIGKDAKNYYNIQQAADKAMTGDSLNEFNSRELYEFFQRYKDSLANKPVLQNILHKKYSLTKENNRKKME